MKIDDLMVYRVTTYLDEIGALSDETQHAVKAVAGKSAERWALLDGIQENPEDENNLWRASMASTVYLEAKIDLLAHLVIDLHRAKS